MTLFDKEKVRANRKAWTEKLRSGEFKQCQKVLVDDEKGANCCLGVAACVLAGERLSAEGIKPFANDGNSLLGVDFAAQFGLVSCNCEACGNKGFSTQNEFASMNDGGKTFAEIADAIDADTAANFS